MSASLAISITTPRRDPVEAIVAAGSPHFTLAHVEEVRRIAGRNEAGRVEHQALVCARLLGLNTRRHAVQLRVAVPHGVLHVGTTSADVNGEQVEAPRDHLRIGRLPLGGDHERRLAHVHRRPLKRGLLQKIKLLKSYLYLNINKIQLRKIKLIL